MRANDGERFAKERVRWAVELNQTETVELLTKQELATRLRVTPRTIDNYKGLPAVRISARIVRYEWEAVLAYLKRGEGRGRATEETNG